MKKICHITTSHIRRDVRIYIKELSSLSNSLDNYSCSLIVADGNGDEISENICISDVGKPKSTKSRLFMFPLKMLFAALKKKAYIYHIHDPEMFWAVLPLRMLGKKVILDLHEDLPAQILSKHYLNKFTRVVLNKIATLYEVLFFPLASALVTATPHIGKVNRKLNRKIVCVSNYPLKDEFKTERRKGFSQEVREVCYTGGITSIRGVDVLIDAVLDYEDNWVLNLAGPVNESYMRLKLEEALKKTHRIKYWGNVSREVLSEIFRRSSAGFVTFLPEPNHVNAIPNKMFEYMSSGLPIICSNFKMWQDIVVSYDIGFVVNPVDKLEISECVKTLFDNPDLVTKMGANGVLAVKDVFNWEAESIKLNALYRSL